MSLPKPTDIMKAQGQVVGQGAPEAVDKFLNPQNPFNDQNINQMYDLLRSLLTRQGGQAVQGAQQTAGALAGARGLVNPSGFISGAGTQAYAPFVEALLKGEMGRNQALQGNKANQWNWAQQHTQEINNMNSQLNPWNQIQPILQVASMFAGIPGIGDFLGIGGGGAPTMQGGGQNLGVMKQDISPQYITRTAQ